MQAAGPGDRARAGKLKVVSGGQSGGDRAALDVALELGLACGGWCPADRWAEDGPIDPRYPLQPTPLRNPAQRTAWNVRDSDATLVIAPLPLSGGTALAARWARRLGRPFLVIDPFAPLDAGAVRLWLRRHDVGTLNVAGPRESARPGIYEQARSILRAVLALEAV